MIMELMPVNEGEIICPNCTQQYVDITEPENEREVDYYKCSSCSKEFKIIRITKFVTEKIKPMKT